MAHLPTSKLCVVRGKGWGWEGGARTAASTAHVRCTSPV